MKILTSRKKKKKKEKIKILIVLSDIFIVDDNGNQSENVSGTGGRSLVPGSLRRAHRTRLSDVVDHYNNYNTNYIIIYYLYACVCPLIRNSTLDFFFLGIFAGNTDDVYTICKI